MDIVQFFVTTGIITGVVTAIAAIIQIILNKKLRTPGDRQSELSGVFEILNGTIQDNRLDKVANEETIKALRDYANKVDDDSRADQELIRKLYAQIHELEERNAAKDRRIAELEDQLAKLSRHAVNELEHDASATHQM